MENIRWYSFCCLVQLPTYWVLRIRWSWPMPGFIMFVQVQLKLVNLVGRGDGRLWDYSSDNECMSIMIHDHTRRKHSWAFVAFVVACQPPGKGNWFADNRRANNVWLTHTIASGKFHTNEACNGNNASKRPIKNCYLKLISTRVAMSTEKATNVVHERWQCRAPLNWLQHNSKPFTPFIVWAGLRRATVVAQDINTADRVTVRSRIDVTGCRTQSTSCRQYWTTLSDASSCKSLWYYSFLFLITYTR